MVNYILKAHNELLPLTSFSFILPFSDWFIETEKTDSTKETNEETPIDILQELEFILRSSTSLPI